MARGKGQKDEGEGRFLSSTKAGLRREGGLDDLREFCERELSERVSKGRDESSREDKNVPEVHLE